jgi:hypothetical protein
MQILLSIVDLYVEIYKHECTPRAQINFIFIKIKNYRNLAKYKNTITIYSIFSFLGQIFEVVVKPWVEELIHNATNNEITTSISSVDISIIIRIFFYGI